MEINSAFSRSRRARGKSAQLKLDSSVAQPLAALLEMREKMDSKTIEATRSVLSASLASFRVEYRARYVAVYQSNLNGLKAELEAANWDIEKTHPYPSGNCDRKTYAALLRQYKFAHDVTEDLPLGKDPRDKQYGDGEVKSWYRNSRRSNDPHFVQMKESAYASAEKDAIRDADASIDGYIMKLALKIGKAAVLATYDGNLWNGSVVTVKCADGEEQRWKTRCILNQSCLGLLFNQWPTRRVS